MEYLAGPLLVKHIPGLDQAELIGSGGQKAVYRATMEGEVVALKLIPLDSQEVADEEATSEVSAVVARAEREVNILDQIDVPVLSKRGPIGLATAQIDDVSWLYFTEEWIEGTTLRSIIKQDRLPPDQVARIGMDLIQAVCWLSKRGLVHRDIKPANVMWATDRSRFVQLDPGIALDLFGPSLTQMPVTIGTLAYLSPEQLDPSRKRNLDFRSDLFAIGVVMYEAAVAEHPFMTFDTSASQVLGGIANVTPVPVAEKGRRLSP